MPAKPPPKMRFGVFREDIVEQLDKRFAKHPAVHKGKMFGHPGYAIGGRYFCMIYEDGIMLKLSPEDYRKALDSGIGSAFRPMGKSAMGTWTVIVFPETEDYTTNWSWIGSAMRYIVTDAAAPVKKSRRKK